MARYHITSLNYIASGSKRCYVNMDTCLEYQLSEYVYILDLENHHAKDGLSNEISGNVRTEQGDLSAVNTRYYRYEDGNGFPEDELPIGLEKASEGVLVPERMDRFREGLSSNGKFFLLKQEDNKETYLSELRQFNRDRFEYNRTFVIPFLNDKEETESRSNILMEEETKTSINPMYEINDVCIKMSQKKAKRNSYLRMTDDDLDIYAPQMQDSPIQFCQTYDNAMMLDTLKNNDVYNLRINLSGAEDAYTTMLESHGIDTIMYTPCRMLSFDMISDEYDDQNNKVGETNVTISCQDYKTYIQNRGYDGIEDVFDDHTHLNGVKYNFIYNLDQIDEANDFRNGNVAADDIFIGKNLYNSTYSIDNDVSNNIRNGREYCGIGFSNGYTYLKYYDNVDYDCVTESKDSYGKNQCSMVQKDNASYRYQKVEFLQKIKNSQRTKHKSNMFSVNVKNTHVNDLEEMSEESGKGYLKNLQQMIKKDIRNAVAKIAENVCPANT
jgi:hypothetical protein